MSENTLKIKKIKRISVIALKTELLVGHDIYAYLFNKLFSLNY
jgi:hypothetical protein